MRNSLIVFIIIFCSKSFALSLLQETQDMSCENATTSVLIEKKDKYFEAASTTYNSVEFLDLAILGKSGNESAIIHMTPKDQAIFIKGKLFEFVESHCAQVEDYKSCRLGSDELLWASSYLSFKGKKLFVKHYGVYPNDGTFFIATDGESGLAIIDFGSRVLLLEGEVQSLSCQYQ